MPMYSLIEYSDNYSKTWESLWRNNRDEPDLNNDDANINFPYDDNNNNNNNNNVSFKLIQNLTSQTGANGTKDVEIMVSLKLILF